jgi:hypothetical protein
MAGRPGTAGTVHLAFGRLYEMSTTTVPTNSDDMIDSRDVIARIAELETLEGIEDPVNDDLEEERDELKALRDLAEQASGYAADWQYGETLIRDSYFKDYAMELADDIGAINADAGWPANCIDWDQAARELRMDYTSVDFDGVRYWIR